MSGGLYTLYSLELVLKSISSQTLTTYHANSKKKQLQSLQQNPNKFIPNAGEFFEIIRYGIRVKNLLGCHSNDVFMICFMIHFFV